MVHTALSRDTPLEKIIYLRNEVRKVLHSEDHSPFLPASMFRIKVEDDSASELRGWLFQVQFTCQDCKSNDTITVRDSKNDLLCTMK